MIIECQQCETRFHLDDERVPEKGVKVRCSKCKHAFRVTAADARDAETMDAIATQAVEGADGELGPEDVFETNAVADSSAAEHDFGEAGVGFDSQTRPVDSGDSPQAIGSEDEEQDWEFNVDPPEPEFDHESAAPDPVPSFLDDLGSPESWDLVGEGDSRGTESEELAPVPEPDADVANVAEAAPSESLVESTDAEFYQTEEAPRETGQPEARVDRLPASDHTPTSKTAALPSIAGIGAWASIWLFACVALWRMWPVSGMDASPPPQFRFGSMAVEAPLTVRSENLFQGPTTIVTAKVRNQGPRLASLNGVLRVEMVSGNGAVLATAPLIRADSADLRQAEPAAYAHHAERNALELGRRPLRPDEGIPVRAVLAGRLPDAVGIRFALDGLPAELPALSRIDDSASPNGNEGAGDGPALDSEAELPPSQAPANAE